MAYYLRFEAITAMIIIIMITTTPPVTELFMMTYPALFYY